MYQATAITTDTKIGPSRSRSTGRHVGRTSFEKRRGSGKCSSRESPPAGVPVDHHQDLAPRALAAIPVNHGSTQRTTATSPFNFVRSHSSNGSAYSSTSVPDHTSSSLSSLSSCSTARLSSQSHPAPLTQSSHSACPPLSPTSPRPASHPIAPSHPLAPSHSLHSHIPPLAHLSHLSRPPRPAPAPPTPPPPPAGLGLQGVSVSVSHLRHDAQEQPLEINIPPGRKSRLKIKPTASTSSLSLSSAPTRPPTTMDDCVSASGRGSKQKHPSKQRPRSQTSTASGQSCPFISTSAVSAPVLPTTITDPVPASSSPDTTPLRHRSATDASVKPKPGPAAPIPTLSSLSISSPSAPTGMTGYFGPSPASTSVSVSVGHNPPSQTTTTITPPLPSPSPSLAANPSAALPAAPSSAAPSPPAPGASSYTFNKLAPNLTGPAGAALSSVLCQAKSLADPEVGLNLLMLRTPHYFDSVVQHGFYTGLSDSDRAFFLADLQTTIACPTSPTAISSPVAPAGLGTGISPVVSTPSTLSGAPSTPGAPAGCSVVAPSSRPKSSRSSSFLAEDRHSLQRIMSFPSMGNIGSISTTGSGCSTPKLALSQLEQSAAHLAREPTLKLTLTPESMRADEAILYGWQRDHIGSTTALPAGMSSSLHIESDPEPEFAKLEDHTESQYIPAGGLGTDVSNSKKVRRVFGKLRRAPKPTSSSFMITSSDV